MAEELGRIDIEKVRKTPQEAFAEYAELTSLARPAAWGTRQGEIQQAIQNRAEKRSFMDRIGLAMMAGGDALTGGDSYKTRLAADLAQQKLNTPETREWKPTTRQEALDFEKSKQELKTSGKKEIPASVQRQKNLDTTKLSQKNSQYSLTNKRISETLSSLSELPMGALGSAQIKMMTLAGSQDPLLQKWQDLKSLLSDIQLGKLQYTKGAISDNEMKFFARASANDDISSLPMITSVLNRAMEENQYDVDSMKASYEKNYEENPDDFLSAKKEEKKTQESFPSKGKTPDGLKYTVSFGE